MQNDNEKFKNEFKKRLYTWTLRLIKFIDKLNKDSVCNVIGKQLLRSGTAIGALSREAQNAESAKDFIHKLGIAQKECDETIYWLELLKETDYLNDKEFESINTEATELLKMLRSAIITSKKNHL